MALVPELEAFSAEIDALNEEASAVCAGLDEALLVRRPAPKSWSVAECLIHLDTTTRVALPAVCESIEIARRRNLLGDGPFRLGWMGRLYVRYVEPPPFIRLPAPKVIRPVWDGPGREVLPRFLESQLEMRAAVEEASGIDIDRARFYSPYHRRWIRMSLHALFAVFIGHERRHLWQAARVRRGLETGTGTAG